MCIWCKWQLAEWFHVHAEGCIFTFSLITTVHGEKEVTWLASENANRSLWHSLSCLLMSVRLNPSLISLVLMQFLLSSANKVISMYWRPGLDWTTTYWHQQEHQGYIKMVLCTALVSWNYLQIFFISLHYSIQRDVWLSMWWSNKKQCPSKSSGSPYGMHLPPYNCIHVLLLLLLIAFI